jgi:hypothetical protein
MVEHPEVRLTPRLDRPGYSPKMVGDFALEGERHGRAVAMQREGAGPTTTRIAGSFPEFTIAVEGDRLRARRGAPPPVGKLLGSLSPSKRWKGVIVEGGPEGIVVERRKDSDSDWLCDLWLAERLAERLAS